MSHSDHAFDPYVQWLGIRDPERPPNHYRLLGLEQFESDPDVIANAADRQMAHVRRFQNGPRSEVSQWLLNELATAKVCLLRPELKADYDERLRQALIQRSATPVVPVGTSADWQDRYRRGRRRRLKLQLVGGVTAGLVAVIGISAVFLRGLTEPPRPKITARSSVPEPVNSAPSFPASPAGPAAPIEPQPSRPKEMRTEAPDLHEPAVAEIPTEVPIRPAAPAWDVQTDAADGAASQEPKKPLADWYPAGEERSPPPPNAPAANVGRLAAMSPRQKAANMEHYRRTGERRAANTEEAVQPVANRAAAVAPAGGQPPPREEGSTFDRLRTALRTRDLNAAQDVLEQLSKEASSFTQRDAADRLQILIYQLERFWDAVDSGRRFLRPGQELRYQQQLVRIVQVDRQTLVVRNAEDNEQTIPLDRREIPAGWAVLLAAMDFSRRGGNAEPLIAAFLSVDREGEPAIAVNLWRNLQRRGWAVPLPRRDDP